MTSQKMKAIVSQGYGSPDVFQLQEVNKPEPTANELLVKVVTTAATTADTMMRKGEPKFARFFIGWKKPRKAIPGTGFAGIVEEVGSEVSQFKVGDRVFGETAFEFSANAEYITIAEDAVVLPLPESMDFSEASNFCDGHLTSYNFLIEIAKIKAGDKVLINGAAGALGTSAIQIAKYLGAEVTAVCSTKNFPLAQSLGADHVIDYRKEDFTKSGIQYDFVYDAVGKSGFKQCKAILTESGTYLSPVLNPRLLFQMMFTSIFGKQKAIFEATGANKKEKLRRMLGQVLGIYQTGKLKTVIDRQFPLEKLAEAHRYIDSGHKKGNIVIYTA